MAARDSLDAEPEAAQEAEAIYSLTGVLRAGGSVATGSIGEMLAPEGVIERKSFLINLDKKESNFFRYSDDKVD